MSKVYYRCPVCKDPLVIFRGETFWSKEDQSFSNKLTGEIYCNACAFEGYPEKVDLETNEVLAFTKKELN